MVFGEILIRQKRHITGLSIDLPTHAGGYGIQIYDAIAACEPGYDRHGICLSFVQYNKLANKPLKPLIQLMVHFYSKKNWV